MHSPTNARKIETPLSSQTLLSGYRQTPVHCLVICAVVEETELIEELYCLQDSWKRRSVKDSCHRGLDADALADGVASIGAGAADAPASAVAGTSEGVEVSGGGGT